MKTNAKIIVSLLAGVLSASALVACSTSSGGGSKNKFEISISARSMVSEQNMLNIWKRAYEEKHPNVTVKVNGWGSSEGTSEDYIMKNALNRSNLTDMLYTTDDSTAMLAAKKNFVDLRPYFESSEETDYANYYSTMLDTTSFYGEFRPTTKYTGSLDVEKSDDAQYGVYFAPREYNMPALLCNVTLFKQYVATEEEKTNWNENTLQNIWLRIANESEWNWDTFVKGLKALSDICVDLNATGDKGFRGCELNQKWEPVYTTIMKDLGSDGIFTMDDHAETHFNLNSEKNKQILAKIVNDFGKNAGKRYMIDTDDANQNFSYRTAFSVVVSYPEVGNYYEAFKKVNYEIDALPFPAEYVGAGCGGYAILKDNEKEVQKISTGETAKTVDLCWDFLKFTISEEGQNLAGREGYIQPVLKKLADTGDWLQSYDGKINNAAFANKNAKELRLDVFCFAEPEKRKDLRIEIGAIFFNNLFKPDKETYVDLLDTATKNVNDILGRQ